MSKSKVDQLLSEMPPAASSALSMLLYERSIPAKTIASLITAHTPYKVSKTTVNAWRQQNV